MVKGLEQPKTTIEKPVTSPTGDSVRQAVKPEEVLSASRSDTAGDQQRSGGLRDKLKERAKGFFKGNREQVAASNKEASTEVPPRDEKGKGKLEESSAYRELKNAYDDATSKAREIDRASLNFDDLRKQYEQVRNTEKELNTKYNQIIKDNKLSTEEGKALLTAKEQYILEVVFVAKDLTRREFQQVSQKSSDYNTDKHITSSYGKSGVLIAQLKKLQQQERILRESLQHEGIQPRDDVSPSKR